MLQWTQAGAMLGGGGGNGGNINDMYILLYEPGTVQNKYIYKACSVFVKDKVFESQLF